MSAYLCVLSLVLLRVVSFAAEQGGSVSGKVVDPAGASLGRASVRLSASASAKPYEASTEAAGQFHIQNLPPGVYDLTISAPQFQEKTVRGVRVAAGAETTVGVQQMVPGPCGAPGATACDVAALPAASGGAQPAFLITGPVIIAFYPDGQDSTGKDLRGESLAEFKERTARALGPLEELGVILLVTHAPSFQIQVGTERKTVRLNGGRSFGYYLVVPGKRPKIQYGPVTDVLQLARDYFGY